MNQNHRGQSLVLFGLTLLLMTTMVMITLSIGSRVKSRMELQTAADTAAYSNAVATARTFNSIAVMNRVQIANVVSTIGTISLISWATKYWRSVVTARNLFALQIIPYALGFILTIPCSTPPGATCVPQHNACRWGMIRLGVAVALMSIHASQTKNKLDGDKSLFLNETTPRWRANIALFNEQHTMNLAALSQLNSTGPTSFTGQEVTQGRLGSAVSAVAPAGLTALNAGELRDAMSESAAPTSGDQPYHYAQMVMGSRGHGFMPKRDTSSGRFPWLMKMLPYSIAAGFVWVDGNDLGRGYLNNGVADNPNWAALGYGHPYGVFAHDKQDRTRTIFGPTFLIGSAWCSPWSTIAFAIGVVGLPTPEANVGPFSHSGVHNTQHSFQTVPPFIDFNSKSLGDAENLFGQPRNVTMVSKDLSVASEPWDLNFNFTFSKSGAGQRFDSINNAGLSSSKQMVTGTGITYYSRSDHFAEPPNMFAPYWRASLSRLTVDRPRGGPTRTAYDNGVSAMFSGAGQADTSGAWQALVNNGYKGFE